MYIIIIINNIDINYYSAKGYIRDISISMCGWEPEPNEDSFMRNVVAFTDLCNNPSLLDSPNLVVRINGKYYNWKVATPIISAVMIYQRPLPEVIIKYSKLILKK